MVSAARERAHKSEESLGDAVARKLGLRPTHLRADLRQKVLAPLNARLTTEGFLIERLLVERRPEEIDFRRAPKGSLDKYRAAIERVPEALRRWKAESRTAAAAVPDINDVFAFSRQLGYLLAGEDSDSDYSSFEFDLRLRAVAKAVDSAVAERARLSGRAQSLLTQVLPGGDEAGTLQVFVDAGAHPVLVLADLSTSPDEVSSQAILFAAFVAVRSQWRVDKVPRAILVNQSGRGRILVPVPIAAAEAEVAGAGKGKEDAATTKDKTEGHKGAGKSSRADGEDFLAFLDSVQQGYHGLAAEGDGAPLTAADVEAAFVTLATGHTFPRGQCADLLLLCHSFHAAQPAADLEAVVARARAKTILPLRALLVHRCKPNRMDGGVAFVPRRGLRPMRAPADSTVDLCFMLDCTGSMGKWMTAAKQHLKDILSGLCEETGVGEFRVAFVGYRDFNDPDRVVCQPFVVASEAQTVVAAIDREKASGGADEPEDVVAGLNRALALDWQGDVRVLVHLADATAHGIDHSSLDYCHDDYPNGTPDAAGTLAGVTAGLRDALGVDLLFCKLNDRTEDMEDVYAEVYGRGEPGFGILPMLAGAGSFKDAIMSTLVGALLGLVTVETDAVQSFDGTTLSSILSTLNASFKESLQNVGASLLAVTQPMTAGPRSEADEQMAARPVDQGAASDAGRDEPSEHRAAPRLPPPPPARGDEARLLADLEGEDMTPVRIVMRMRPGAGSFGGLATSTARTLLDAGVTVDELAAQGYPAPILAVFREAGASLLKRVA